MFKKFLSKKKISKHEPTIGNPYDITYSGQVDNSSLLANATAKYHSSNTHRNWSGADTGKRTGSGYVPYSVSNKHYEDKDDDEDKKYGDYLKGLQEIITKHDKISTKDWNRVFGSIIKKKSKKTNKRKNKKNKRH